MRPNSIHSQREDRNMTLQNARKTKDRERGWSRSRDANAGERTARRTAQPGIEDAQGRARAH